MIVFVWKPQILKHCKDNRSRQMSLLRLIKSDFGPHFESGSQC